MTLERYVFRQIVAAFALAVFAMAGILLVGMAAVMLRDGYSIVHARAVWKCLLLSSFPYAAPVALMCAVTLVFGRMSGDNELSAAASSGVRPERMAAPAWLLGALVAGACFWMNHWVLPLAQRDLFHAQERFLRMMILDLGGPLKEMRVWPYRLYVEEVDLATGDWVNIAVFEAPGPRVHRLMRASRGRCRVDNQTMTARLEMENCLVLQPGADGVDLRAVQRWLKENRAQGMGMSVAGPMSISLDVDLSRMRRRNIDSPELLPLPELRAEDRRLEDRAAGMPSIARPLSVHKDLTARRGYIEGQLPALRHGLALAEKDMEEAKRREEGATGALEGARRRLAEAQSWPSDLSLSRTRLTQAERAVAEAEAALARNQARVEPARRKTDENRTALESMEAESRRVAALSDQAAVQQRRLSVKVELHRRTANAIVCLAMVAAAMPLGAMTRKGSVIYAVAASLALVLLVHYPLDFAGRVLTCDGWVSPLVAGWAPAAAVGALAAGLHCLAMRR